jgi:uncharacterized repeat protein (TIGR01451 family)
MAISTATLAIGTDAGRQISNQAVAQFSIAGQTQAPVTTNVSFWVDELLDATLVSTDIGPVAVLAPQIGAIQQYNLTNTGNGIEAYRLIANDALAGDDFDAAFSGIFIESNSQPGLQVGSGGDAAYVAGANDPLLAADTNLTLYVTADIPASAAQSETSLLELRAIPITIVSGSGTDDPSQPAFPSVGTSYTGLGDPANSGSGNVLAMVGTSFAASAPAYLASHEYLVGEAGVAITKTAVAVIDPSGGSTVVPGSVVDYQIIVMLAGAGSANALRVVDVLPLELAYAPGSLSVIGLPIGEDADDNFIPAGADNTGFNAGNRAVEVNFGDVEGPLNLQIDFKAIVQ